MQPLPETQWEFSFKAPNEVDDILHLPGWQRFRMWIQTYGGNKVMQYCFKFAAPYGDRFQKHKRMVSFSLIWELVRDHMKQIRRDAERKGIKIRELKGYALCNDLRSYAMRYLVHRRPDWDGMFLMREQGSNRSGGRNEN